MDRYFWILHSLVLASEASKSFEMSGPRETMQGLKVKANIENIGDVIWEEERTSRRNWAADMVLWRRRLLSRYENLHSNPRPPSQKGVAMCPSALALGK